MKKFILTLLLLTGTCIGCFAQMERASIGGDLGLTTGQAAGIYDFSAGFSIKTEFATKTKRLKLMATLGYSNFVVKKDLEILANDADYLRLETGAKYYLNNLFYLEGDVGVSTNVNSNYTGQRIGLSYEPAVGISIPALDFDHLTIGVGYDNRVESGGTISQVTLHVAYQFALL